MSARVTATALAIVLAFAAQASAKVPPGVVTAEDIMKRAELEEQARKKRKEEAEKDPTRELIDAYRDKKTDLKDWAKLTAIIADAKSPEMQPYRRTAAEALVKRFEGENTLGDAGVREVRRNAALAVIDLMDAKGDDVGVGIVDWIYYTWYRNEHSRTGFRANSKLDDRRNAKKKMKKYLQEKD